MIVAQLMKESPACIAPSASLSQAARIMKEVGCGILPVADGQRGKGRPLGVLTDRDIVMRCLADGRDPQVMTVGECCSEPAICCDADCTAEDAFHTMRDHAIGRLPVIDGRGNLVGILSMADIIARVPRDIWNQLPGAKGAMPRKAA